MPWVQYYTDRAPPMTQAGRENNVSIIWNTLGSLGYSAEAVAAICGNMQYEGLLNPQQFEINRNYDIYNYGAGLCGWTPVYVTGQSLRHLGNWCDSRGLYWLDGDNQLEYLNYELTDWDGMERFTYNPSGESIGYPNTPPITSSEFITSVLTPYDLAVYWCLYYEHPAHPENSYDLRGSAANNWYQFITGLPAPTPPVFIKQANKLPIWMMTF